MKILAREYFALLAEELKGSSPNKNEALRRAQAAMPTDRTLHTLKDRCYRISEELWKRDLPWVQGWKPPQLVGQSPNSHNVSATIWAAIEPFVGVAADGGREGEPDAVAESASEPESDAQGYLSDSERRRAIEDVAQNRLMGHFVRLGWTVEDTHLSSPFDARATKGTQVQYLEAKGTTTDGGTVLVTRGEVEWARNHPGECVMGILSGVLFDPSGAINESSGDLRLLDWNPDKGELRAVQYEWKPL